jgi:ATP-dependent exoDNAse (exonuclease V) beta subunit
MAASDSEVPEVTVESASTGTGREHGKRFGTLVHAVLALVDLNADRVGVESVARLQGRLLGATAEEIGSATAAVAGALSHPVLRRAALVQAGSVHSKSAQDASARTSAQPERHCRREVPIALVLKDGLLVEGIVDLAFFEPDSNAWTVVDFKTDVELEGRIDEYRRQVGLYAKAIARATGRPAKGVILKV